MQHHSGHHQTQKSKNLVIMENEQIKIQSKNVCVFYGEKQALFNATLSVPSNKVTALIGPSGCGKSTFLRCLNRMNDMIERCRVTGTIAIDDTNIYHKHIDVSILRRQVGMVFQKPNPFPKTIFDNVAYGPRIHSLYKTKAELQEMVEDSLKKAGLWQEVKDELHTTLGTQLSGGQQQRLCIARCISVKPHIILMDEPCSSLDPIATANIERLIDTLKSNFTIVVVTHSMQQAGRISKYTSFFHMGKIIETDLTEKIFTSPDKPETQDYITGRFG